MSDILQIFSGNPLSTFIGKKIEAATRPELESEDWALNMEICDIINENDDDAKDAVRAIRKRLQQIEQDRNFTITNRTLTVLETCVSNCSHRFHVHVMTKDFIQELVKLIGPKNNPPIELQERVLRLIERWAEAFRLQPDLGGVVSVCNDLKAKGVTFPPRDSSPQVPITTPQRSVPSPQSRPNTTPITATTLSRPQSGSARAAQQQQQQPPGQVLLEGEGYNKISQDLTVVQSSIEMFNDILKVLESPTNEESDWTLAGDLNVTCRQMKDRIVDLIERVANEDLTIELLRLNDDLNNIFTKYDRLVKNANKTPSADRSALSVTATSATTTTTTATTTSTSPSSGAARPSGVSSRTLNDLSLIDFNANSGATSGDQNAGPISSTMRQSVGASGTTTTTTGSPVISDPFDTSNIIPRPTPAATKGQQPPTDALSKLSLGSSASAGRPVNDGKKPSGLPEEISSVREQDFAEIENWLSTDSGRDLASIGGDMPSMEPISIPNSEFENFIATRALAGSSGAKPATTTSSSTQQTSAKRPEPSS